jgi:hypothetical protein
VILNLEISYAPQRKSSEARKDHSNKRIQAVILTTIRLTILIQTNDVSHEIVLRSSVFNILQPQLQQFFFFVSLAGKSGETQRNDGGCLLRPNIVGHC